MNLFPLSSPRELGSPQMLGFIDETGKLVINQNYYFSNYSRFNSAGYAVVKVTRKGQIAVIDRTGKVVLALPDGYISPWMTAPDEYGLMYVVHQVDHDKEGAFEIQGRDIVYVGEARNYMINLSGEIVFEARIGRVGRGYYELIGDPVNRQRQSGIISHQGEVVVEPHFEWMSWSDSEPFISVMRDGKFGVIDYLGREILPFEVPVRSNSDFGRVKDGDVVFWDARQKNCVVYSLSEGIIARVPATYWSRTIPQACPTLSDGLMSITKPSGEIYYLDRLGQAAMPGQDGKPKLFPADMRPGYFNDGFATYRDDKQTGYINKAGEIAIEAQFDSAIPFSNGLAKVFPTKEDRLKNRYGYINTSGEIVVQNF